VDYLLADIYRSAIKIESLLHGYYCAINAGAITTWGGE
jgi:hypothetical protein